jgi:hypothetical protein
MDWSCPLMRCPGCGHVGKPKLEPGTTARTWAATCAVCRQRIKEIPRLRAPLSQDKPQ